MGDIQVERNLKGIEYEKLGLVKQAMDLYEQNVAELFEGSHPYDRLAVIYHKQKRYEDEKSVLEAAIFVFENMVDSRRGDRLPKLHKFKTRLEKLNNTL